MEQRFDCQVCGLVTSRQNRDRINRNITDKVDATLVHKLRNCLFSVIAH